MKIVFFLGLMILGQAFAGSVYLVNKSIDIISIKYVVCETHQERKEDGTAVSSQTCDPSLKQIDVPSLNYIEAPFSNVPDEDIKKGESRDIKIEYLVEISSPSNRFNVLNFINPSVCNQSRGECQNLDLFFVSFLKSYPKLGIIFDDLGIPDFIGIQVMRMGV